MKVYHVAVNGRGRVVHANYDKDDFAWENTTSNASVYEIDEVDPINKDLCLDIMRTIGKEDVSGLNKYDVNLTTGELEEEVDWEEKPPEFIF